MIEDVLKGENPNETASFPMLPVPDLSQAQEPRGYAWRRFDDFWFATDSQGSPLVGQFKNHAATATAIMGGTLAHRPDLDFGSPIPV